MPKLHLFLSLFYKCIIIIAAAWGVGMCTFNPGAFMGGKTVWLFFTIQSNVWIAIVALIGIVMLVRGIEWPRWMSVLQVMMTVAITLTGLVYCFMLAPLQGDQAFSLTNILTHVVVPLVAVIDFFWCSRLLDLSGKDAYYVLIPPVYYLCFASLGYILNWQFAPGINYPYFFLNWGSPAGAFGFCDTLPYMGVMYYVLIMLVALLLFGRLYIAIATWIRHRS